MAALLATACTAGAQPCEPLFARGAPNPVAHPSLAGVPGLYDVPVAARTPDRSVGVLFHSGRATVTMPGATQQRNGLIAFGFLPGLTLTARGSVMNDTITGIPLRDLSANAHYLVSAQRGWRPALAIGAQDVSGANAIFTTRYAVASMTLAGRARTTLGVSSGIGRLGGPIGGIEIAPCSWLQLLAENDGRQRNIGVRVVPLGTWGAQRGIEGTVDLLWRESQGRMAAVGLRVEPRQPPRFDSRTRVSTGPVRDDPTTAPGWRTPGESLPKALVSAGFENVRAGVAGDTITVAYENRVFNREEWTALGVVMGEVMRHSEGARVMRVTVLRVDVPVLQVTSGIEAFRAFMKGSLSAAAFAEQLTVGEPPATNHGPPANPSRFRTDVTVRPRIRTLLLSEISVAETQVSALPEVTVRLGSGVTVAGRRALGVYTSSRFPDELLERNADRLVVHVTRRGGGFGGWLDRGISQVSLGRFGPHEVGVAASTDRALAGGRLSVGGTLAAFGETVGAFDRSVALGTLRARHAPLDLTAAITAGRFLHGDVGAAGEVQRRFGLMEVAFFARSTDFASTAGIRVSVPLTTARDPRPRRVRLRLPDYYDHAQAIRILADIPHVRTDVGNQLDTGQEIANVLRDRDRLHPPVLLRHVESLRAAALRYVGSGE